MSITSPNFLINLIKTRRSINLKQQCVVVRRYGRLIPIDGFCNYIRIMGNLFYNKLERGNNKRLQDKVKLKVRN